MIMGKTNLWSKMYDYATSPMSSKVQYDVIVVGAGVSGLNAAYQLVKSAPDLKILVLEAKDRVGGRTWTTKMKSANGFDNYDLGGQWVSNSQKHIMNLLFELGLDTYPQFETGTKLLMLNDGSIRTYSSFIPKVSWLSLLDLQWFLYKFENLAKEIDVEAPYDHPRAAEFDATSMETFKQKHIYTETTKQLVDICIRAALGCEAVDLSVLFLLTYAKAAGGFMKLLETTKGGAQEKRVKGGCLQISQSLASHIGMENIKLSTPVKAVYQHPDSHESYSVGVLTDKKELFVGKHVIMAIPLHLAANIEYEPPIPHKRLLLMKNMPVGHMTKYIITYQTAFWRTKGFSGEVVSTGGPQLIDDCDNGPLGVVFDATSAKGNPALVGFLAGNQGIQWTSKPFVMRKLAILKALAKCFGDEAMKPLEFLEKNWSEEPYNGGCPVNVGAPGTMKYMNEHFRNPFLKIHWAGTETASSWCGYINGAVQSGSRAAKEVLFHLRPLTLSTKDKMDALYSKKKTQKKSLNKSLSPSRKYMYLLIIMALLGITIYIFCHLFQFSD